MNKLSNEEKKAIAYLKLYCTNDVLYDNTHYEQIKILLNLIEKQQKEIEELKKPKYIIDCETNEITMLTNEFISKDKIREKIEELEKEQENNRKSLDNAINILYFKEIDKISNRICVNMTTRDILHSLLEEE